MKEQPSVKVFSVAVTSFVCGISMNGPGHSFLLFCNIPGRRERGGRSWQRVSSVFVIYPVLLISLFTFYISSFDCCMVLWQVKVRAWDREIHWLSLTCSVTQDNWFNFELHLLPTKVNKKAICRVLWDDDWKCKRLLSLSINIYRSSNWDRGWWCWYHQ